MVKAALIAAVLLQIVVSLNSEGLARSVAELTAFLITIALVFVHNKHSDCTTDKTKSDGI
ncbi:hypothetical protein [Vibrio sp. FJH11]